MPVAQVDPSLEYLHANKDGSVSILYEPKTAGIHEMSLNLNDQSFEGSQVRMNVGKIGDATITSYGSGLYQGFSGKKARFHVTRAKTLTKTLEVRVEGPEKAEPTVKEETNGWIVEYTPLTPGEYLLDVRVGDVAIPGSPFSAKISGQGTKKTNYLVQGAGDCELDADVTDLTGIIAYIKPPQGNMLQAHLTISPKGKLTLTNFQPRLAGKYMIDVNKDGHKMSFSPVEFKVKDEQLCDHTKVKVSGNVTEALANQNNQFTIDISQAGFGDLSLSMEGPYRVEINHKELGKDKKTEINYNPPETGTYILAVKYGGEHVTDSPFVLTVGGKGRGNVRQAASIDVQEVEMVEVGKWTDLYITLPGCSALDLEAVLTNPDGESEQCEVRDQPESKFIVKLTPEQKGLHIFSLKMKGVHVNGSPLPFTVGGSIVGGPHKVEFGGIGADVGVQGVKNEFNLYTREAGSGALTVSVDGPSKANIVLKNTSTGFVYVAYTVEKEGEYIIGIKFDGIHVPKSPFTVQVDPDCPEAKNLTIQGFRDRGIEIEKPVTFSVKTNGCHGDLSSHMITPSGDKGEVTLESIDTDEWLVRFVPKENGVYYVAVKFNKCHIPGSPLPILVGTLGADPALVVMSGPGLSSGSSGRLGKFNIGTVKAGSGQLSIQIEGPARVPISVGDTDDGYEVSYTPPVRGEYLISAKFCNVLVPGCPFVVKVTGLAKRGGLQSDSKEVSCIRLETQEKKGGNKKVLKGDASKVVVQGPALKKAFAGRAANFTIDVKEAGNALLSVSMVSPKGLPVKELSYKKQKPGIYQCSFTPEEKGEHQLVVRWGEDDVIGSPFLLNIG